MNSLKSLTTLQWLGVTLVINGALIGSTAQLTDLMGAHWAHIIVSVCSLGNSVLGGIVTMFSGQGTQVLNVKAMAGVDHIDVNEKANPTLAKIAMDPNEDKIAPTLAAQAQVAAIAKGT
jgi:hypothetical protein